MTVVRAAILLKFRDMVTEPGGTIREHRERIDETGHAWWGWWSHQSELIPRDFLHERDDRSQSHDDGSSALLFDSGAAQLFHARVRGIVVAPTASHGLQPPSFENTPSYYHRGRYHAWFKLDQIDGPLAPGRLLLRSHPTLEPDDAHRAHIGETTMDRLRGGGQTMWTADFETT